MSRKTLEAASEELRKASELAEGDLQERLYDHSNQVAELASRDQGPDHGRLDRHMNALYEIAGETDGDLHDRVVAAREHLKEYRKGVAGV
ncbi:hypothetical protein C2R22_20975 [Salinigranum rubrum]|uniref:Uncharacterized protein n=1 Tax=Salinigranum rubrum TaxID=755307 RepID=A0A2I8VPG5_9EURY|nr:hypothetical protein [Salinigranum rubrum]AUV83813.1 hypothetical protein C2R22_20975 [Salinigranum rubrum]